MNWFVPYFLRVLLLFLRLFFEITVDNFFSFNFCAKIIDIVFFVWARFVMFLDGVCICLGCVYTLTGLGLFFCIFCCSIIFFHSITTPNLLLLCYCQKWQVPIFVGWVSFLLLLYHFCFCLGCMHGYTDGSSTNL